MLVTFNGLVVREDKSDDYGKYITVLSDTYGRVFMSAKGVSSVKNKNAAACRMFTFSEFVAYYRDGKYTLKSASPIGNYIKQNTSLEQLALASYIAEIADIFSRGESDTSVIMRNCINAIYIIYKNDRSRRIIKSVYELKMLCNAGYMPDVHSCAACGCDLNGDKGCYFCYVDGVLVCDKCNIDQSVKKIFISAGCLNVMRHIINSDDSKAYAIRLPENTLQELYNVCQEFLLAQLEKKPDTLDYYNTIEEDNVKF
ncbi:MAG: DNA repair protein RecO [Clostridia bacterium]|nr:DNA repair protein RecO [Clostridia bacterium]